MNLNEYKRKSSFLPPASTLHIRGLRETCPCISPVWKVEATASGRRCDEEPLSSFQNLNLVWNLKPSRVSNTNQTYSSLPNLTSVVANKFAINTLEQFQTFISMHPMYMQSLSLWCLMTYYPNLIVYLCDIWALKTCIYFVQQCFISPVCP